MAERDGAAVDVDELLVGAEQPRRVGRDRGEGLVDLDRASRRRSSCRRARARRRPPSPACARGRRTRRRRSPARRSSRAARSRAARAHSSLATRTHEAPSLMPGALPAVVVPSRSNTGFSAASFSSDVSRRGLSSASSSPTGTSSSREAARVRAPPTARCVRAERPRVLLLARDPELAGDERGLLDHVQPVEARVEPVVDHQVDQRPVAEPVAEARPGERVRRVRHRLHPARDDELGVARADHRVGDLDRADRRGADLVDRVGGRLDRDPRADRRLPRRRLAGARLQHLAHDHVVGLAAARSRRARAPRGSRSRRARSPSTRRGRRRACRTASSPRRR